MAKGAFLSYPGGTIALMWRYTLRDLKPGDDPETWARAIADEGWRMWIPGNQGADTVIAGDKVRRYSLRRWTGKGPAPANEWKEFAH